MSLIGSSALSRRDQITPGDRPVRTPARGRLAPNAQSGDCPFCGAHLDRSKALYDQKLFCDRLINVVPDLGPLCPGHLLAASRRHVLSMAELGEAKLGDLARTLTRLTGALSPHFGDYFWFEHGTPPGTGGHGACIDHAHIHMLPMEAQMYDRLMHALPWQPISRFEDLARFQHVGYAYLGIKGSHYVFPAPEIGSQWIRREVGAVLGRDDWDWALTHGHPNLLATVAGTRQALPRRRYGPARFSSARA